MAAKKKTEQEDTHLSDAGTSSKANRLAAEKARQKEARATRDQVAAELKAAQEATAARLKDKPTDTRNIGG